MAYIEFKDVSKKYQMGEIEIKALDKISFDIEKGELVVILGPSGAGKTTCLRRFDTGFVFQFYNLIQNLTALENVELAVQLCKDHLNPEEILEKVGLKNRLKNFPSQLSGGEQQRVSIARAIAKNPKLLLCDEPTGALDYKTGKQILELLEQVAREEKMTVIIITHNSVIAEIADKVIKFNSGQVQDIILNKHPKSVQDIEW